MSDGRARNRTNLRRSLCALAQCCTELEFLSLSGRHSDSPADQLKISDAGLIELGKGCPRLSGLSVGSDAITDAGLAEISGMNMLALDRNDSITLRAPKEFVRRSPNLCRMYIRLCGNFRQPLVHSLHEFRSSHPTLMRCLSDEENEHNQTWERHNQELDYNRRLANGELDESDDSDDYDDDDAEERIADEELVLTFLDAAGATPDVIEAFDRIRGP